MLTVTEFLTQEPIVLKVVFPIGVLLGIALITAAIVDPSEVFTGWYEDHKGSKLGIWGVSRTPKQFRAWHVLAGLVAVVISIAGIIAVF